MTPPILLGSSNFPKLRQAGGLFVDKSHFIAEVLANPSETVPPQSVCDSWCTWRSRVDLHEVDRALRSIAMPG